ncbi:MAG: ABC transporter substrate-binding protein [Bacilli bacterium]|nr:ABC transporter substrate-binding protein [Bacilli bacterium]
MRTLKKLLVLVVFVFVGLILSSCKKDNGLIKIKLAEVTHSVFYAPQYVAMKLGYFEEEGLEIDLILTPGADKVMAALLSKDVQVGLCGPEAAVFVYNREYDDYPIGFAQLTQRDGSFIFSREDVENWSWDMLKGKSILGGRKGGMPLMTLEYVLKNKGLEVGRDDPSKEVHVRTDVEFAAMAGSFESGQGDYTTLFEPLATSMEKLGKGYVVASVGAESGDLPYTVYHTAKSYAEKNPEIIQKFTNAIYKGQQWVKDHSAREIAETIITYFPELTINDLTDVTQRHKDIDAWQDNPYFGNEGYEKMLDIIAEAGELTARPPYDKIINNDFSSKYKD